MRRTVIRSVPVVLCLHLAAGLATERTPDAVPLPPFQAVRQTVEARFIGQPGHGARDLLARSEVEQALASVERLGWVIEDKREILEKSLPDGHVLVKTLRTPAGRRFMHQISGRALMYDRLDRISQVPGGPRLIQDLVKLPDGERYAKPASGGGVPDLLDLLPKNASGQTRRINDYHQPTGHIYTVSDLVDQLAASYKKAEKTTQPLPTSPGRQVCPKGPR